MTIERATQPINQNDEIKERGGFVGKKEHVFFADDFYICHQSI